MRKVERSRKEQAHISACWHVLICYRSMKPRYDDEKCWRDGLTMIPATAHYMSVLGT